MSNNQPFITHLEELRLRILYSLAGIIACTAGSLFYSEKLLYLIRLPLKSELVFIAPHEAFFVTLKVCLLAGIIISCPFTAYQIWKFISSALKTTERKFVAIYVPVTFLLFLIGVLFGFMIVLPAGLKFLLNFAGTALTPMITADKYVSFVFLILLVFGVSFQLPLVMRVMTSLGIVEKSALKSGRRYAVVAIFVISALLTPPDVFTQIALALPIILLYEIGLLFSRNKTGSGRLKG